MDTKELPTVAGAGSVEPATHGTGDEIKAQARRLTDAVRERALATSDDKKSALSEQVGTLAEKLDGIANHEAVSEASLQEQLLDRGVGILRRIQRTLDENSTKDLIAKAEQKMKARPGLLFAGCLAIGFFGARLVRK